MRNVCRLRPAPAPDRTTIHRPRPTQAHLVHRVRLAPHNARVLLGSLLEAKGERVAGAQWQALRRLRGAGCGLVRRGDDVGADVYGQTERALVPFPGAYALEGLRGGLSLTT